MAKKAKEGCKRNPQCSCFPVRMDPSGGNDIIEYLEYVVSFRIKRAGTGGGACRGAVGTCSCVLMVSMVFMVLVVGSVDPLRRREGRSSSCGMMMIAL